MILVTGIEGALKSSFIFNMISNYIAGTDEHGLYASLEETKEKYDNLTVFALDSINAFYSISTGVGLRKNVYKFFTMLRDKDLTSFLIMETRSPSKYVFVSSADERAEYFLADGVIELGVIEAKENVKRYVQIKKMRTAHHIMEKYQIMVGKDGLSILGSVY